jgi:hypothetical protein
VKYGARVPNWNNDNHSTPGNVVTNYDILGHTQGNKYLATTQTITSVTPDGNGVITIDLVPKSSVYWTASVNGIEVLKP